ncbi:MAG: lipoprotein insertase outer membrane protein LolB [Xanthomonadales bacterium]|nr:lipoprotein insertase outer membrane protein LolB [Xanthomonadales bacterium]
MALTGKYYQLAPVLLLALLTACTTTPIHELGSAEGERLYGERRLRLASMNQWELEGRLAVRDGDEGGSGHLTWRNADGESEMDFYGAFGRGAWRLTANAGVARLELADGSHFRASSVEELVRNEVGWDFPVDALAWWVRGLAAPGSFSRRGIDEEGLIRSLEQHGWVIEYQRYASYDDENLPIRLTARRGDSKIKLVIRDWRLEMASSPEMARRD